MSICETIEMAFGGRGIPSAVLDVPAGRGWFDSDEEDALWFDQRDWHSITWKDWTDHYNGIFFFTPEALAYYLPSILTLSAKSPNDFLMAAQSVLIMLAEQCADKDSIESRKSAFLGLKHREYKALREWLVFLCETGRYAMASDRDIFDRALARVEMLAAETPVDL